MWIMCRDWFASDEIEHHRRTLHYQALFKEGSKNIYRSPSINYI
jgi:hypothetical protein